MELKEYTSASSDRYSDAFNRSEKGSCMNEGCKKVCEQQMCGNESCLLGISPGGHHILRYYDLHSHAYR